MQSLFKSAQICFHPICASVWGLFDRASSSWNNVKCQLDATRWYYWCILSSTCFGRIRRLSGALDVELQHMVFWTEFLDGWWSWEQLRTVVCTVRMVPCTAPSALDVENYMLQTVLLMMGVCARPETCRAKNTSIKSPYWIKLVFHFISKLTLLPTFIFE